MLRLRKVAITGGLSCGKSSVCRIFKELGAYVVSADEIVHQLLSPNTPLGQQVISLLGKEIVVNGKIKRSKIAQKVFCDQDLLQSLETLLHPVVLSEIEKQYQQVRNQGDVSLFIAEIPLLFECKANTRFDYTIAVVADAEACKQRFKASTGYEDKEYEKRMEQQMSPSEKTRRADYVIENNGSIEHLRTAVSHLFMKFNSSTNA